MYTSGKPETVLFLTNCSEKMIHLYLKKKPTNTTHYTAWLLDLSRGGEGIKKGQTLKKRSRCTERLGCMAVCALMALR